MSSNRLTSSGMSSEQRDLHIGIHPESKFNCNICNATGEDLYCWCSKCQREMHPSCAGVEAWIIVDVSGEKKFVLPSSEKIPNSCCHCLSEQDGIMMRNRSGLQLSGSSTDQLRFQHPSGRSRDQLSLSFSQPSDISLDNLSISQHSDSSTNQLSIGQSSGSSITSFFESGMGPAHKPVEGDNNFMVHVNKPGHQLKQKDNWNNYYTCSGCKIEGFGEHYKCENASCCFLLHKECMYPCKIRMHEFFPRSTFSFSGLLGTFNSKFSKKEHTNIFCNACGSEVNGYFYHSLDGMIKLHPVCINLPRQIICGETGEEMVLMKKTMHDCNWCRKRGIKVDNQLMIYGLMR